MSGKLSSQERVFEITRLLYENHIGGLTNKELATLVGTSEVNICRDIAVFEKYGWVSRGEHNRLRLSMEFGSISGKIIKAYQNAKLALATEEAEYLAAIQ